MKFHFSFAAILGFILLAAAYFTPQISACLNDYGVPTNPDAVKKGYVYHNIADFTVDLLTDLHLANENGVFISPVSIYTVLLLLYLGSREPTESQLQDILYLAWANGDRQAIASNLALEMKEIDLLAHLTFASSNTIYYSNKYQLNQCLAKQFPGEFKAVDFNNPTAAVSLINDWIAKNTNNEIKNMIKDIDIDQTTELVLANAVYFKGSWETGFLKNETTSEPFYVNDQETIYVDMMYRNGGFSITRDDNLQVYFIELPYSTNPKAFELHNPTVSMFIVLPYRGTSVKKVLLKMDAGQLRDVLKKPRQIQNEIVGVPKFDFEKEVDLLEIFQKWGLEPHANLEGFIDSHQLIRSVKHKAKISVNEEGTIAAGASAVITGRSIEHGIICNRPFLFFIANIPEENILFAGTYTGR